MSNYVNTGRNTLQATRDTVSGREQARVRNRAETAANLEGKAGEGRAAPFGAWALPSGPDDPADKLPEPARGKFVKLRSRRDELKTLIASRGCHRAGSG